ncbi:MAG: LytTR family DNA-binding domain-containing protein [Paludibacteraceae bacterium]|nr:LytTR family DNA-binding domain-containing protein [Paludibacteraceae bacterium]
MNITCAIIDDEPLAVELLTSYVEKTPFLSLVGSYNSAVAAMADFANSMPDLLFLDIQMPDLNGLELSKIVGDKCRIIFTTAFEQYALESYKVNALDYLLKPFGYSEFLAAATKAHEWFELKSGAVAATASSTEKKSIWVKADYKLMQIDFDQILYIEGLKDYVKIVLYDDQKPVLTLMSMKTLETDLPASLFVRVHRSFIVQPSKIRVIDRNRIVFGKQYIPISDSYKDKFFEFMETHALLGYKVEK